MVDPHATVELLCEMIRNGCVNDGSPDSGQEVRNVGTLAEFLGREGQIFEPHPSRQSSLYRVPGSVPGAPRIMLMGHTDVVPAGDKGWDYDPFAGEVHDGFVWGRGAVDMLNVTAAMASVFLPYLIGEKPPLPGDLLFLAVADEEAGGTLGAEYLTTEHWDSIACEYVLNEVAYPAFSTASGPGYPVNVGEKGPFWRTLTASGTPGHGSAPHRTDNALIPVARAAVSLGEHSTPIAITREWEEFVTALGLTSDMSQGLLDPERIDETISMIEDLNLARFIHACTHLTVSPNLMRSGGKVNTIPELGQLDVDIRALPGQTGATIDAHLQAVLGPALQHLTVEPMMDFEASSSTTSGPLWEAIVDGIEAVTGSRKVLPTLTPVTTDLRFFRNRGVVGYGVGLYDDLMDFSEFVSLFHGRNERVSTESILRTTELLDRVLVGFGERTSVS